MTGLAVVFGLLALFGGGMYLLYLSGWIGIESTPGRLIISKRERNRYDPPVTRTYSARLAADWDRIRELEWALDGRYYTGPDGQQLADDDPAALTKECHAMAEWMAAAFARKNDKQDREVTATRAAAIHHGWPPGDRYSAHGRQVANTRAGRPADQGPPGVQDVTPKDISDMSMAEFDQFRRQVFAAGGRIHRGMFG